MTLHSEQEARDRDQAVLAQVDYLNDEVKSLALNLAIFLARLKAKTGSAQLTELEPDFIRLVNGTVKAVNDITTIINAARHRQVMAYEVPSGRQHKDQIEVKLHGILEQCNRVLLALHQARDIIA